MQLRNLQPEERDSVNTVKGIRAKNWIPRSCSQMESEEIVQHFTSTDLTTFCKHPSSLRAAGLFTCRYAFPTKRRDTEPAVGGPERTTGRAQETQQPLSSVLPRHMDTFHLSWQYHEVERSLLSAWRRSEKGFQCLYCLEPSECKVLVDATCATQQAGVVNSKKHPPTWRQASVCSFLRKHQELPSNISGTVNRVFNSFIFIFFSWLIFL